MRNVEGILVVGVEEMGLNLAGIVYPSHVDGAVALAGILAQTHNSLVR